MRFENQNEFLKMEVKKKLQRIKQIKDLSMKRELARRAAEDYSFDQSIKRRFENLLRGCYA